MNPVSSCSTTTGTSLAFWKALEESGELRTRPTTFVYEYAAHPKYVQALSERIDEGLQRFPTTVLRMELEQELVIKPLYATDRAQTACTTTKASSCA